MDTHRSTSNSPVSGKPPESSTAEIQRFLRRFIAENQSLLLGSFTALLIVLAVIFVGQKVRARGLQAAELLEQAQTAEDMEDIVERYKRTPSAPLALLQAARMHYENGAFQQAYALYERFIEAHADHPLAPSAELGRLHCFEVMGRLDEALAGFETFLQDHHDHPLRSQAVLSKGRCLEAMGRTGQARTVYEDFIEFNPESRWLDEFEQALKNLKRLERLAAQ